MLRVPVLLKERMQRVLKLNINSLEGGEKQADADLEGKEERKRRRGGW